MKQGDIIDESVWVGKDEPLILPEQRGRIVETEGERGGREFKALTAPLDFYEARRYITRTQHKAGNRLHALWRGSILESRYPTMKFGERLFGFDPESMALMPRDYFKAMDAVSGFREQRMVRLVCCFGEPAGGGTNMQYLKSGLDDLVRHFQH